MRADRCFRTILYSLLIPVLTVHAQADDKPASAGSAAAVQPFVDNHTLAGAVMLVADKDKILQVDTVGYADVEAQSLMGADTLFWIASESKPITAALLMMLWDEGKLALDEPVAKYLPEFADVRVRGPDKQLKKPSHAITVRELLTHTSGLAFQSPEEQPTLDGLSLRDAVFSYAKMMLIFEPGSKWQYSNAGINTAGRIVEVVSGMPFEAFLEERLLTPLAMKDTTFWPNENQLRRLAKAYRPTKDNKGLEATTINQLRYPLNDRKRQPMPAGGLFSTASDMAHFCQLFLAQGVYQGKRLLSAEAVAQMTRKQVGPGITQDQGLGWFTGPPWFKGGGEYGHGGALSTNMIIDTNRGLVMVWMVQHAGFPGDGARSQDAFRKAAIDFYMSAAQGQSATDVWIYKQSSGELWQNGKLVGKGYSGHGKGVNNPDLQKERNVGPIPRGEWIIGEAFNHERLGPITMRLTPAPKTDTFGRSAFLIHGDNAKKDKSGSEGCIIIEPAIRQQIANSKSKRLLVTK